jgi:ribosomal protein S18 acetylase RimI-like enzyme
MMEKILIRPFTPDDRQAVMSIAADTAFFGEPVEHFLNDRALFCDLFLAPYLDHDPQSCFVAEADGEPVGYILGSHDHTGLARSNWSRVYLPAVLNIIRGRYRIRWMTIRYGLAAIFNTFPPVPRGRYPADLHINILSRIRGRGVGRRLLEAYQNHLIRSGIRGVYLHTTDRNPFACQLYEKMGYSLLGTRKTLLWQPWLGTMVENRTYAKILQP